MNNILNNMSDFEKIIFVNNINEDTISVNGGMRPISTQYPFVLFLSNQTVNDGAIKISNLWHNGIRLTRFIGIDKEHSTIDLGNGHEVRLDFNYDTGKLGIYDVNPLKSISIMNIGYTTYTGDILRGGYEDIVIDSINNTFDIYVKFESEKTEDADVRKINSELYFYDNEYTSLTTNFTVINKSYEDLNLTDQTITYKYTCKINKDTFINNTSNQYKIVSPYSSSCFAITGDISLYLNPESYNIESNGSIIPNNGTITYSLDKLENNSINLSLSFTPNNITTYDSKKLYVKIHDESGLITNDPEVKYDIINGISKISLKVNSEEIEFNTSKPIKLKINVYRKIGNNELNYQKLEKTININITGHQSNKFIYCGYVNPINISFSDLISVENKTLGKDVLWDWKNQPSGHEISMTSTNPFYIAIPSEYAGIVKPRIDAYVIKTVDGMEHYEYVDNSNAFELIGQDVTIANQTFKFYIYKSLKFNGFYYGKIQ